MMLSLISITIGIILFLVEVWCAKHTWVEPSWRGDEDGWKKYGFKNVHLILLLIMNVLPVVNLIGAIVFFVAMYVESDRHLRLIPPDGVKNVKPSKLDKWLNKTV